MLLISKLNVFDLVECEKCANHSLQDFCVIDLRGKQAFLAAHLKNSHHLPSEDKILSFLKHYSKKDLFKIALPKPFLILCFSAIRARKMSENLAKNTEFLTLYPHKELFYLNCGIMEAFDSGFELCAGEEDFEDEAFGKEVNTLQGVSGVNEVTNLACNYSDAVNLRAKAHLAAFTPPPPPCQPLKKHSA